jgi:opacity protein-like surface antigen
MKNLTSTSFAAIAAGFLAFSAPAARSSDLLDGLNEPAPAQTRTYFQGLAVGVDGGGQFTSIAIDGNPAGIPIEFDGISADGLIGGAHVEYLFAVDRFRLGAYGEGGFSNVNTTLETPGFDGDVLKMDHYYGAGLKAGVTVGGSTLLFARAGYDWSQWSSDLPGVDEKADAGSWLVGGGIETMIGENVSLGLGGDYLFPHDVDVEGFDATPFVEDSEMLRIKAKLTWRQ